MATHQVPFQKRKKKKERKHQVPFQKRKERKKKDHVGTSNS
jgi:hypothetical protein